MPDQSAGATQHDALHRDKQNETDINKQEDRNQRNAARMTHIRQHLQHAAESKHHGPVLGADVEVCEGGLGLVAP